MTVLLAVLVAWLVAARSRKPPLTKSEVEVLVRARVDEILPLFLAEIQNRIVATQINARHSLPARPAPGSSYF
ncbi:MAG: hypothetical protein ABJB33_01240 [Gemmatimonadota bacterium]